MRMIGIGAAMVMMIALAGGACAQPAATAEAPQGRWITASGNLEVEIAPCGEALCGTIVRVIANNAMSGSGQSDAPPPEEGGLLITELRRDGAAWRGRIFNREDGRTYDCVVRPRAAGALEVRPYVGIEAIGRSQIWRRPAPSN